MGYAPVKQARQKISLGRSTARIKPSRLRYPSESAPRCSLISGTVFLCGNEFPFGSHIYSKEARVANRWGADAEMNLGSTAFLSRLTTRGVVVPRTILSSTTTSLFPAIMRERGLNFNWTPSSRILWSGSIKVRPT